MSKRSVLPQSRRHLLLYDEDWEFIEQRFCADNGNTPGVLIREMLHRRVMELREKENQAVSAVSLPTQGAQA